MSDQYVPALRQRFLEDMQIKGQLPKTHTMICLARSITTQNLRKLAKLIPVPA